MNRIFTSPAFLWEPMSGSHGVSLGGLPPCFLSEIPELFRSRHLPLDVALIHVSPPDKHGFCSLGVSVDVAVAAVQSAKIVIAQVNPRMPRVNGDGMIHESIFDAWVDGLGEIPEEVGRAPTAAERRIGELAATLIGVRVDTPGRLGSVPNVRFVRAS